MALPYIRSIEQSNATICAITEKIPAYHFW